VSEITRSNGNGIFRAWLENIQLQFDHINSSLQKLDDAFVRHDERLIAVEKAVTIMQTKEEAAVSTGERHERQIEKMEDRYISLIKEWGPWVAVAYLIVKDAL